MSLFGKLCQGVSELVQYGVFFGRWRDFTLFYVGGGFRKGLGKLKNF